MDIKPHDVLLDVGGSSGKVTEVYAKDCKEIASNISRFQSSLV